MFLSYPVGQLGCTAPPSPLGHGTRATPVAAARAHHLTSPALTDPERASPHPGVTTATEPGEPSLRGPVTPVLSGWGPARRRRDGDRRRNERASPEAAARPGAGSPGSGAPAAAVFQLLHLFERLAATPSRSGRNCSQLDCVRRLTTLSRDGGLAVHTKASFSLM
jgi:hypothetical protein